MTVCSQDDSEHRFGTWIAMLIHLVRSRSLVYAFAISALGTFLISSGGKVPDFSILIRLVTSTYMIALATYLYNDVTDYHTDKINNKRSVQNLEKDRSRITICYTIAFFVIATILAFSINTATGIASLIFSGLAIAYSNPRIQLKNMFIIKTAVTGGGAFITAMMGCLASGTFSYLGIISSLIAFLFYFILGPLGDISDLNGDSKAGRRTFPIVLGIKKTLIITITTSFSIALLFFISNMYLGISIVGMGCGMLVTVFILSRIYKISKHPDNKLELNRCRRSIRYCIFACQISLLSGVLTAGIFY